MSEAHIVLERRGPERPWLGQLVRFDVQLWRPTIDAAPLPAFDLDEVLVPGAIARFREEAPPPDEKREGDQDYLVQHRTLVVFPEREGALTLPALVARWTENNKEVRAQSSPVTFQALAPPHADEQLVVTSALGLEQSTSRPLRGLAVGDGFVRTVALRAQDSDPLVLPPFEFENVPGLSVYPASPRDTSSDERGELVATRTFQATYVVERVGHYQLRAAKLRWLEPASGRFHEAVTPELGFWARPNPALGLSMWGTTPGVQVVGLALSFGALALFVWLLRKRLKNGPFRFELRLREAQAERRAFARLRALARSGSALATLSAAYDWLRVRFPLRAERTLTPLRESGSQMFDRLDLIERSAFGAPAGTSARPDAALATDGSTDIATDAPTPSIGTAQLFTEARRRLAKRESKVIWHARRGLNDARSWKGKS
jgi:hypothetical protein